MKISKFILIGFALAAFSLTSCKKDFICDCHIDTIDDEHIDDETKIEDSKKSDAEESCEAIEKAFLASPENEKVNCDLK